MMRRSTYIPLHIVAGILLILAWSSFTRAQTCPLMDTSASLQPDEVSFSYQQLVPTVQISIMPKTDNHSDEPPFMNGQPEHIRFLLGNFTGSNYFRTDEPQLLIYPISRYRSLFSGNELIEFNSILSRIDFIFKNQKVKPEESIPILPAVEAYQVFHANDRFLEFMGGRGIRFITIFAQDPPPITNDRIFYTFQGVTGDGKYYIALYHPLKTKYIPNSLEDIRETIIPVLEDPEKYQPYLEKGKSILDHLKDPDFEPDLSKLDEIIQSLVIDDK